MKRKVHTLCMLLFALSVRIHAQADYLIAGDRSEKNKLNTGFNEVDFLRPGVNQSTEMIANAKSTSEVKAFGKELEVLTKPHLFEYFETKSILLKNETI